jgi:hypothetical protein
MVSTVYHNGMELLCMSAEDEKNEARPAFNGKTPCPDSAKPQDSCVPCCNKSKLGARRFVLVKAQHYRYLVSLFHSFQA